MAISRPWIFLWLMTTAIGSVIARDFNMEAENAIAVPLRAQFDAGDQPRPRLVDARGVAVRLACVNWAAHMDNLLAEVCGIFIMIFNRIFIIQEIRGSIEFSKRASLMSTQPTTPA